MGCGVVREEGRALPLRFLSFLPALCLISYKQWGHTFQWACFCAIRDDVTGSQSTRSTAWGGVRACVCVSEGTEGGLVVGVGRRRGFTAGRITLAQLLSGSSGKQENTLAHQTTNPQAYSDAHGLSITSCVDALDIAHVVAMGNYRPVTVTLQPFKDIPHRPICWFTFCRFISLVWHN